MSDVFCINKLLSSISTNDEFLRLHNKTRCNTTDVKVKSELPVEAKTILGILYIAALLFGTFGNLLAICTMLLNKRMHTAGNLLLLNLSISDLIITMICMPVILGYQVLSYPNWPYSEATCKASKYLVQLSVFCSVLTLLTISIHRYFILQCPLKPCFVCIKKRHIFILYWVCALLFTIPTGLATQVIHISDQSTVRSLCIEVYRDRQQELLHISIRTATYFFTVLTLSVLHSWIVVKLWKNRLADLDHTKIKEIKTAVRLLLAATIVFSVCWLPYVLNMILAISQPQGYQLKQGFDIFGNFLGLANSVLDPFIYCYYNKSFRTGFRDILQTIRGYLFTCKPRRVQPIS